MSGAYRSRGDKRERGEPNFFWSSCLKRYQGAQPLKVRKLCCEINFLHFVLEIFFSLHLLLEYIDAVDYLVANCQPVQILTD